MTDPKTFPPSDLAFNRAIAAGVLSSTPGKPNYAGGYMFMWNDAEGDHFKHADTRKYTIVPNRA